MKYLTALITILFFSCGPSAKIEKSWKDPGTSVNMNDLQKVLVVAMLKDEASRRTTEDKLVSMLNGKGVASYNYLTEKIKKENEEAIRQKLKDEGFNGAIVMRLADVEKDIQYLPGSYNTYPVYYGRFWGYYWNAYSSFYSPGYYQTTKTYKVETNVYSFKQDKLVWSGLSVATDPSNLAGLMENTAKAVYDEMKKDGFIQQ